MFLFHFPFSIAYRNLSRGIIRNEKIEANDRYGKIDEKLFLLIGVSNKLKPDEVVIFAEVYTRSMCVY